MQALTLPCCLVVAACVLTLWRSKTACPRRSPRSPPPPPRSTLPDLTPRTPAAITAVTQLLKVINQQLGLRANRTGLVKAVAEGHRGLLFKEQLLWEQLEVMTADGVCVRVDAWWWCVCVRRGGGGGARGARGGGRRRQTALASSGFASLGCCMPGNGLIPHWHAPCGHPLHVARRVRLASLA
jgi:hypothetical protein